MQIALTPAHHDTTDKALIYALMPAARPSLPASMVLPKYVFADEVYRKHPPKLRERAPACVTFTRTFGAIASCTFPGRSQHYLSSRQCTSLSVRRHSWPVPVTPFISVMHQPPQCGAIPGRFQCTLSSRKYSSPSLRHSSCQFPVHDARRHGTNLTALAEMNSPAGTAPCTSLAYMSSPAGTAPCTSLA